MWLRVRRQERRAMASHRDPGENAGTERYSSAERVGSAVTKRCEETEWDLATERKARDSKSQVLDTKRSRSQSPSPLQPVGKGRRMEGGCEHSNQGLERQRMKQLIPRQHKNPEESQQLSEEAQGGHAPPRHLPGASESSQLHGF